MGNEKGPDGYVGRMNGQRGKVTVTTIGAYSFRDRSQRTFPQKMPTPPTLCQDLPRSWGQRLAIHAFKAPPQKLFEADCASLTHIPKGL